MKCCCGNCEYYKFDWERFDQEEQEISFCDNQYSENYKKQTNDYDICGEYDWG